MTKQFRTDSASARELRSTMIRDMSTGWRAPPVRHAPPPVQREDRSGCADESQRFDFIQLESARLTPEGWIMDSPIVTRTGVFTYRRLDGTVRREYRPPEEVFSTDALRSMRGAPVTDGHRGRVTKDMHTHSIIGTVISDGRRVGEAVVADVVIHAPNRMGARRELSLGYAVEMDLTPGVTPDGQRYDAVQRNIRINHLAVVEKGRAGIARLRLDSGDSRHEPGSARDLRSRQYGRNPMPASAPDARRQMVRALRNDSRGAFREDGINLWEDERPARPRGLPHEVYREPPTIKARQYHEGLLVFEDPEQMLEHWERRKAGGAWPDGSNAQEEARTLASMPTLLKRRRLEFPDVPVLLDGIGVHLDMLDDCLPFLRLAADPVARLTELLTSGAVAEAWLADPDRAQRFDHFRPSRRINLDLDIADDVATCRIHFRTLAAPLLLTSVMV